MRAQAAPVVHPPATLLRRTSEIGAESHAGFPGSLEPREGAHHPSPAPAEDGAPRAIHLPPATAIARRAGAEPVTPAGQTNFASRKPAPGVIRGWGEPIVQHMRGHLAMAPAAPAAPKIGGTTPSLQAAGAGTLPLQHLPGAGIETASPAASPPVVRPEKTAHHDEAPVERASAGPGVAQRRENPFVSPSPDAGLPENGSGSGSATVRQFPSSSAVPVVVRVTRSPVAPARAGGRDVPSVSPRADTTAILRQAAPGRAAPASPAQKRQPESLSTLPVSRVISTMPGDYAGAARSSLPLPVERRASSATMAPPLQRQASSALPSLPLQRQAEGSPASAPPAGAGGSQGGAAPGGSQAAPPPAPGTSPPGNEGRVRLDELEMDRVANAVLELLKQRLQMEREARGL
jgi:hypothetical protein